jgi:hypothetical protein
MEASSGAGLEAVTAAVPAYRRTMRAQNSANSSGTSGALV